MPSIPPAAPDDWLTVTRLAINAPSAACALQACLNQAIFDRAREAGFEATRPIEEEPAARRPGSWLTLLGAIARADGEAEHGQFNNAPVAGFWVTAIRRGSDHKPPFGGGFTLLANASVERAPEPHRDPLAFGPAPGRSSQSMLEETRAYWEARDLRDAVGSRGDTPRPPRLGL